MSYAKFAHLLGLKKKASEEEDDKEKSKKAKSRRAEDERDDEEDAEDDDDHEDMEDDDDRESDAGEDDDDKEKGKKAKSRRAEEDDDADAEEDDENRDVKKGRRAERKRCAAIFGSKHAAGRPDMAAHLAFNTRLNAREAIETLATMGAANPGQQGRMSLDARMRESDHARLGPDAGKPATGKNALVSKMTSLYDTARGNK